MPFFQTPPGRPDLYRVDDALRASLARLLPDDVRAKVTPVLEQLGADTTGRLWDLMEQAEREPPRLVHYDPWGRRVDDIVVSGAWEDFKEYAAHNAIVACGYHPGWGEHARVAQAAVLHLFSATSATYSCPLAMTDAAARVLIDKAPSELRERLVPRLLSREPATFITSGQWMTERAGGSDVGGTETIAKPLGGDRYALYGTKWFTSATTSEMALTLARVDDGAPVSGSKGLSLFCVEIERVAGAGIKGILVNRLKDKLGTKALPTAELTLDGVVATRIGEPGRGVANISGMLNVTRLYNAIASVSGMHRAVALAKDYAERRVAFGARLVEQPLHAATLADMEAETAAAMALTMECARLLGRQEAGTATEDERTRLRALIPLAKLTTAKQAVAIASEALECFGGAGYVEDTGLPRLLRDAQVLPIWEGTTNVLSLDVLRAEAKSGSFRAVVADLGARVEALPAKLDPVAVDACRKLVAAIGAQARALMTSSPQDLERSARRLAQATGWLAEATLLAEGGAVDDGQAARFARFARAKLLAPLQG